MKKLFLAFLSLVASTAFGATLVPVQLLNPTGSSSGQAIVSSGSSSAPAWGGVGLNGIAAIPANTVLGNATGSSASPTAISTTGSGSVVLGTSPTITTPNIQGVTNGAAAPSGSVGQIVTSTASSSAYTTGTTVNVTSISLPAGVWDIQGSVVFHGTTVTNTAASINTVSATMNTSPGYQTNLTLASAAGQALSTPVAPLTLTTTTTVYLVGFANGTGTMTVDYLMRALRIR
jgi:hypothetical protein